ncbi:hypothetical protein [Oenococcus oeni]|uniref:hypothetical protein n=2 Tax=Lactobacillales TaxID=186826 RepID=UPI000277B91A|nr:hypothetical protein [Oenococcus oeni]EJO02691.1 hypothetical protein AWRIB418_589 [Oenococcus oeni AWRIB418]KGH84371.1 hypothetical protein X292_09250 [Oenococcus oeni IOEB_C28]OIM24130.1 hypothetical protein ATX62_06755 [Oenococcus oeni]OIM39027.1 hypothetical protein ATX72_06915 [Oenococcus oeni]QGR01763.1 hypothetical protein E4R25_07990 [Oenococcus oeni]
MAIPKYIRKQSKYTPDFVNKSHRLLNYLSDNLNKNYRSSELGFLFTVKDTGRMLRYYSEYLLRLGLPISTGDYGYKFTDKPEDLYRSAKRDQAIGQGAMERYHLKIKAARKLERQQKKLLAATKSKKHPIH